MPINLKRYSDSSEFVASSSNGMSLANVNNFYGGVMGNTVICEQFLRVDRVERGSVIYEQDASIYVRRIQVLLLITSTLCHTNT